MKRVTCHGLIPDCSAVFFSSSSNDLVIQYVIHAALMHRHAPVLLEDLLATITTVERPAAATEAAA